MTRAEQVARLDAAVELLGARVAGMSALVAELRTEVELLGADVERVVRTIDNIRKGTMQ